MNLEAALRDLISPRSMGYRNGSPKSAAGTLLQADREVRAGPSFRISTPRPNPALKDKEAESIHNPFIASLELYTRFCYLYDNKKRI